MKRRLTVGLLGAMLMSVIMAGGLYLSAADGDALQIPKVVEAGSSFSIPTRAAGKAVLYIVSPAQVLRRNMEPGESVVIAAGDLHNAGHYLALLAGPGTTEKAEFDVVAARQPASLNFLAKPSRLPVSRPDGISGVAYVFDVYRNLVGEPTAGLVSTLGQRGRYPDPERADSQWSGLGEDGFRAQGGSGAVPGQCGERFGKTRGAAGPGRSLQSENERPAVGPAHDPGNRAGARLQRQPGVGRDHRYLHPDLRRPQRSHGGRAA